MSLESVEKKVSCLTSTSNVFEVEKSYLYMSLKEGAVYATKPVELNILQSIGGYFQNVIRDAERHQTANSSLKLNMTWDLFNKISLHFLREKVCFFTRAENQVLNDLCLENFIEHDMLTNLKHQVKLLKIYYQKGLNYMNKYYEKHHGKKMCPIYDNCDRMTKNIINSLMQKFNISLSDMHREILELLYTCHIYYNRTNISSNNFIQVIPQSHNLEQFIYSMVEKNQSFIKDFLIKNFPLRTKTCWDTNDIIFTETHVLPLQVRINELLEILINFY